jgi:hypothetical protein
MNRKITFAVIAFALTFAAGSDAFAKGGPKGFSQATHPGRRPNIHRGRHLGGFVRHNRGRFDHRFAYRGWGYGYSTYPVAVAGVSYFGAPVVETLVAPVVEAPVVDTAAVADTAVVKAPVTEAPVVETPEDDAPEVAGPVVETPEDDAPAVEASAADAPDEAAPAYSADDAAGHRNHRRHANHGRFGGRRGAKAQGGKAHGKK